MSILDQSLERRARAGGADVRKSKEKGRVAIGARSVAQARNELGGGTGRGGGIGSVQRPGHEGPRGARAHGTGAGALERLGERFRVARMTGDLGEDQPAPEVALGAAQHGEGRGDRYRQSAPARQWN